jgi:hypothetical protein
MSVREERGNYSKWRVEMAALDAELKDKKILLFAFTGNLYV